eukprot:CAMPEP_0113943696 /NCGR_PEP_ID=MMETSP1339-20121228/26976_1 /TAXON_ID=94617 /ORGANISM="Fibrocapsa japonica" /LENGTH=301 /DNA_ID=CAMNT_0000948637 /DNA_START=79 /DNA_END=984 /DNA_ORIENTATION=- /assembly_acc=CAM_ASM_000762
MASFQLVIAVGLLLCGESESFLASNKLAPIPSSISRKAARSVMTAKWWENEQPFEYFDPLSTGDGGSTEAKGKVIDLPLFPLGMVAAPFGKCPLQIYEMRYRRMMNDIQKKDEKFGMAMVDNRNGGLMSVGTIMRVTQRSLLEDGRQLIVNEGVERFRILELKQQKPYTIAAVEIIDDDMDLHGVPLASIEEQVWECLQDVVRLSNKMQKTQKSIQMSKPLTYLAPRYSDTGLTLELDRRRITDFSLAVLDMLDIPPLLKQMMLQTTNTYDRLEFQLSLLDPTRKLLAAQSALKDALNESA